MKEYFLHEFVRIDPAFHDLDPMEIVWHGHYFKYFEIARCALLQRIDYDYPQMRDSGFAWPVVDCRCRYVSPIRFAQNIEVHAYMVEYENRLKIEYEIMDVESGKRLCKASTTQFAVDMAVGEACFETPEFFRHRVELEAKKNAP